MDIWDMHCHLAGVPGDTPADRLAGLLKYADRMGIGRLCICMGMSWTHDPSPEVFRKENDWDLYNIIRKH